MRVITTFLIASLVVASQAWNLQSCPPLKQFTGQLAKGCATAAACATLVSPLTVQAADGTALRVNIDTPYVLDMVKTKASRTNTIERFSFLAESVKNLLGPAVSVELPTDIQGVAKQAFSGGATVSINGQDLAVKVVKSEHGALTVKLSNKFLPALPFAGLGSTPGVVNAAADGAARMAPAAVELVSNTLNQPPPQQGAIWDRPIAGGRYRLKVGGIDKALTPLDVVGFGSLALGVVYAGSFGFYKYAEDKEASAAAEKKKDMAAKRASAEAKKKKTSNVESSTEAMMAVELEPQEEAANASKTNKLRKLLTRD